MLDELQISKHIYCNYKSCLDVSTINTADEDCCDNIDVIWDIYFKIFIWPFFNHNFLRETVLDFELNGFESVLVS